MGCTCPKTLLNRPGKWTKDKNENITSTSVYREGLQGINTLTVVTEESLTAVKIIAVFPKFQVNVSVIDFLFCTTHIQFYLYIILKMMLAKKLN